MNSNDKKNSITLWLSSLIFGVIGGFLGGGFFGLLFAIESMNDTDIVANLGKVGLFLSAFFMFGLFGIFFGFIPAFLTGLLAHIRNLQRTWKHYVELFIIGCLCSGFYMSWLIGVVFGNKINEVLLVFMAIGGLSAVIVGRFFLPKSS